MSTDGKVIIILITILLGIAIIVADMRFRVLKDEVAILKEQVQICNSTCGGYHK
jgi:hypothetical protein